MGIRKDPARNHRYVMRLLPHFSLTLATTLLLPLAATAADGDLPFVGMWDCEIAVLTFSNDTYHDGTNEYPMSVTEDGDNYVVTLTPDYIIGLSKITADKMTFAPIVGGDLFACFRLE